MNYEEKYKEAIERAKQVRKYSSDLAEIKRMEEIFPELRESADEKTRNQIINFIEEYGNPIHCEWQKDWIAWLEKQGQKLAWSEADDKEFKIAINALKNIGQYGSANWVKSIKQRIGG